MFRVEVTPEEYEAAQIGGEYWKRVPDEDGSSVFIVTAVHLKKVIEGKHCLITGAFANEPKFVHGDSGIRNDTSQEMAKEGRKDEAVLARGA